MVSVKQNPSFTWSQNAHGYALLYYGRVIARVSKNNPKSYSAESNSSKSYSFRTLSQAKQKAYSLAKQELATVRHGRDLENEILDVVNKHGSKAILSKHGKATRVSPAFALDEWKVTFEDGHTITTKVPKIKNPQSSRSTILKLRTKIKSFQYGLPTDQATSAELALVKRYPRYFQIDRGYIKIKRRNPVRANPKRVERTGLYTMAYIYDLNDRKQYLNDRKRFEKMAKDRGYTLTELFINNKLGFEVTKPKIRINPKNPVATPEGFKSYKQTRLKKLARMFQGQTTGQTRHLKESDFTPNDKYRLGHLVLIRIRSGAKSFDINFDGEALLAADMKNNLWASGKDARIDNIKLPPKGDLKFLGEVEQVDYVTNKKHIEGNKTVRFYHKLGEVTKEKPNLFVDHEGYPIFVGGAYDVWSVGIVN